MNDEQPWAGLRAAILDMDGSLWRGSQPLPGLARFFDFLRAHEFGYVLATNNSVRTPESYRDKLAGFGIGVELDRILTSAVATAQVLLQELGPGRPLYVIGEEGLVAALTAAGFTLAADAAQPVAAVVVGGDRRLTYDKLKHAVLLIQRGARLVGSNPDVVVPTEEGLTPEAGATLAALTAATGATPMIVGKPERWLFELALARLGTAPAATLMVGDRLDTDILGGRNAGLRTALVTTGVDGPASVAATGIRPDVVLSGLDELVDRWSRAL